MSQVICWEPCTVVWLACEWKWGRKTMIFARPAAFGAHDADSLRPVVHVLIQFALCISAWVGMCVICKRVTHTAWLIKRLWNVRRNVQIAAGIYAMLNSASLHKGLLIWCQTHSQTAGPGRGKTHWKAFPLSHGTHTNTQAGTLLVSHTVEYDMINKSLTLLYVFSSKTQQNYLISNKCSRYIFYLKLPLQPVRLYLGQRLKVETFDIACTLKINWFRIYFHSEIAPELNKETTSDSLK